ncbi:MAG: hypothetical protein D6731_25845 [Planctomycetota bacterium]|nr:MAG: hypothetical protein D6731_25845 [Planctomycetota bacterium]
MQVDGSARQESPRGRGPAARRASRAALVLLSVVCGCVSAQQRLFQGEALLARGEWDAAAEAFVAALDGEGLSQLERDRAAVGEARAFIGRGDLVGAEARLRRLSDQLSAKWYYLGRIQEARKDREGAIAHYRRALERRHGGDTALRLARLIGGEARSFEELLAAARVLRSGGELEGARALEAAAEAWRGLLAGAPAGRLLEGLVRHERFLSTYPSTVVLRARLLEQAGDRARADLAWAIDTDPPPSLAFVEWARERRAQDAIARGDMEALARALERADKRSAARVRELLAVGRLWRGDRAGAQALWRATVDAGGEAAPLAAARLAASLELEGRKEEAARVWPTTGSPDDARLALLRARRAARRGDLLGGCALLAASARSMLEGAEAARADDLLACGALLRAALAAYAHGDDARAAGLARSVVQAVPLEPASLAVLAERVDGAPEAQGTTLAALQRARLARSLRAGDLAEARRLVGWWKVQRMEQGRGHEDPELEAFREVLERFLHAGLREGLVLGRAADAAKLLAVLDLPPADPLLARLRACDCLRRLDGLPAPRGLAALPSGVALRGHLAVPARGLHFSAVAVTRTRAGGWILDLPGAFRASFRNDGALAAFLGAPLDELRWAEHLADVDPTQPPEAWRRGPPPKQPLQVE